MKRIFTLIAVSFITISAFSQANDLSRKPNNAPAKLSISSMTADPVKILVDGNNYSSKSTDDITTINDIKPGYHTIKVYQQKKNKTSWRQDKSMKLVYEANIYVKARYHVDVVINRFGKAFVDEKQMNAVYYNDSDYDEQGGWSNGDDNFQPMNGRAFEQFKQVIRNENFDNTKVVLAKQTISSNYFSAAQIKEVLGLFSFENSKIDIAKAGYINTIDKNNYFILNDAFAYSSTKEDLARFIQAQQ